MGDRLKKSKAEIRKNKELREGVHMGFQKEITKKMGKTQHSEKLRVKIFQSHWRTQIFSFRHPDETNQLKTEAFTLGN